MVVAAAIQVGVVLSRAIPLGIRGEWVWDRHAFPTSLLTAVSQFIPAVFGVTVLQFVARFGNVRLFLHHLRSVSDKPRQRRGPSPAVTGMLLFSLVLGSWVWLKTVQRCAAAPDRELKSLWVLYDPSSSGYFYEAAFRIESTPRFLSSYATRIGDDVLHVGTHPPGLFLLSRLAIQLCGSMPFVSTQLSDLALLRSDKKAFRHCELSARLERPLSDSELAALVMMSELTCLAAALTVIPLYNTVRRCFNALIAWRVACLWATLPCLAVFLPKSDVLFTLTSMTTVSVGVTAITSTHRMRKRIFPAVVCGLLLWCGLMLSLAHLPVLALLAAMFFIRRIREKKQTTDERNKATTVGDRSPRPEGRRNPRKVMSEDMRVLGIIVGTVAVSTLVFSLVTGCNMLSVWQLNLRNHGAFYDAFPRTAWKWLLVNPLELGMAIGLPLALASFVGLRRAVDRNASGSDDELGPRAYILSVATALAVAALWLSCRNSGEAARLWCFLTPWIMLLPAHLLRKESKSNGVKNTPIVWHTLLLTQMVVGIVTAGCVSGFSF